MRDRANLVQANPTKVYPGLCLSGQLFSMRRIHNKLYEFGSETRNTLNKRAATGQKQPALNLGTQLQAMQEIDQRLFEYGYQLVTFLNAL